MRPVLSLFPFPPSSSPLPSRLEERRKRGVLTSGCDRSTKLKNIEDTEKAKRRMYEEQQRRREERRLAELQGEGDEFAVDRCAFSFLSFRFLPCLLLFAPLSPVLRPILTLLALPALLSLTIPPDSGPSLASPLPPSFTSRPPPSPPRQHLPHSLSPPPPPRIRLFRPLPRARRSRPCRRPCKRGSGLSSPRAWNRRRRRRRREQGSADGDGRFGDGEV